MEEIGFVTGRDGIYAKVLIGRKSGCCESCEKSSCDIPEDGIITEAVNPVGAQIGQRVRIVMQSHTYLKGILILYILPVLSLILGLVFGGIYLPEIVRETDEELLSALGGFTALCMSLLLVKLLSLRMEKKTEHRSVIEEILDS